MTDIIFSDKRIEDISDQISDSEMCEIFEQSGIPWHFDFYKKRRKSLIRFTTLLDITNHFKSFPNQSISEHTHKYYWNGENYVRCYGWIDWDNENDCYKVVNPKYLVYLSYEDKPEGKKYIGSFTHKEGINDAYLGSYTDKEFKPDKKIILCECETREAAYEKEREMQIALNVVDDPTYVNKVICDT